MRLEVFARYVGTQESSILNVALGKTTAAGTWPQAWRTFSAQQPELASQLEVKWKTPALINNSIMVRDDVDEKTASRLSAALVAMSGDVEGQRMLKQIERYYGKKMVVTSGYRSPQHNKRVRGAKKSMKARH